MSKTQRWDWAIGLDLTTLSDQHLQKAYKLTWDNLCKFDSCRKNCKRILCLACFDKTWIDNDGTTNSFDSFETTNCEQKRPDLKSFVGLKNLGATCYVNCLLQLWFHNPALRKAIYQWDRRLDNLDNNKKHKVENSADIKAIVSSSNDEVCGNDSSPLPPNKRPRMAANASPKENAINSVGDVDTRIPTENELSKTTVQDSCAVQEVTNSPSKISANADRNQVIQKSNDIVQNDPIQQLQLIFARLQFTNKKSIDPFNFIESLALNAAEQQDAQEFGNLFIEFLEKSFANQKNKFVSNIIKNQFLGKYSYATICDHCKHSSVSDSNYYELDLSIQNLDTLHDCLNEYFRPVPLDGKYNCSHCQKAQSAHRKIILKSVPPTLNLQLLRFVYDKQRNTRQKLNSFIIFPEILDMTPYLNDQSGRTNNVRIKLNPFDLPGSNLACNGTPRNRSNIYILTAVLIHRGSSPHSGHYIAHIKDRTTKDWYKFNDDCVERIGPQLQVSTDGENITIVEERTEYIKLNDPASGKVIKMESKSLKSKTAYMLVYQAHNNEALTYPSDHSESWALPDHLQCSVAEENSKSDEMFESLQIAREVDQQVMEVRRNQIRTIYDKLICRDPSDKFEFINKTWLQNWLTNPSTSAKFPPIDNSHLLCVHEKLDFRKLDQVKCVRTEGADLLYKEFGGGPRLQDAMCKKCVELEVELIQLKERMKEDQKFITSQAKFKLDNYDWYDAYIVGRNSYRDWQALVMVQFEKSHPELANRKRERCVNNSSDEDENKASKQTEQSATNANSNNDAGRQSSDSDDDAIERFVFNSDIQCEHGQLIGDTTAWRIVPREVWAIFKRYFGNNPEQPLIELNANTIMCAECRQQEVAQQEIGGIQKQIASEQKSKLPDLFHMRKRASWCSMTPGDEYYILDKQFLTRWQKFLRNPCNQEKPTNIMHAEKLLCKHNLSLYNSSNSNPLLPECPFVLISAQELEGLKKFYTIDHAIKFHVNPKLTEEKLRSLMTNLKTSPSKKSCLSTNDNPNNTICLDTSGDPVDQQSSQLPVQVEATSNVTPLDQQKSNEFNGGPEIDLTDIDWSDCIVSEPEYCSECHELLKQDELKKLLNYDSATIYISKCENRTARRNRSREQAYTIKPNQTLLELKKEIFSRCQVLPVDQRLFLDDTLLDDNSKTMAELMIVPNCSLRLEIDRPMSEAIDLIEDESTSRKSCAQPETGFKGSLLLSNNHF